MVVQRSASLHHLLQAKKVERTGRRFSPPRTSTQNETVEMTETADHEPQPGPLQRNRRSADLGDRSMPYNDRIAMVPQQSARSRIGDAP